MSRMAGMGRGEEEACRVVEEVEGHCGTKPVGDRNLGDRMTWSTWSSIEEGRTDVVTVMTFLAVKV